MKKCPYCAIEEIQDDVIRCRNCEELIQNRLGRNPQQKKKIGFWGGMGIIILVLVVLGIIGNHKSPESNQSTKSAQNSGNYVEPKPNFVELKPNNIESAASQNNTATNTNQIIEEKSEAIGKPVFGILLGENIAELKKRYSINSQPANEDERQISKLYIVGNKFPEVKVLQAQCFNDRIFEIDVFLINTERSNFDNIVEQIKTKYSVLKETIKNDKSYPVGNVTFTTLESEFLVRFDNEDVIISPLLDKSSDGITDTLIISYTYERLNTLVKNEYEKMWSREKENERKNKEASKKRFGGQL